MLPEAKQEDLVYAFLTYDGYVEVYALPSMKPVGSIADPYTHGICSDTSGNVFLVDLNSRIVEYPHGSFIPSATLSVRRHQPLYCAVDPNTNSLAVTTDGPGPSAVNTVIFPNETGKPKYYYYRNHPGYLEQCVYDDHSNLFVVADGNLTELRSGTKAFQDLKIKGSYSTRNFGAIQWDGKYITVADGTYDAETLNRLVLNGTVLKIVGKTRLKNGQTGPEIAMYHGKVIGAGVGTLNVWKYPAGGNPLKTIYYGPTGLAISLAPKS